MLLKFSSFLIESVKIQTLTNQPLLSLRPPLFPEVSKISIWVSRHYFILLQGMEKALKLKEKQGQAMQTLRQQDSHHFQAKPPKQELTTITTHVERHKSPPEDQVKIAATAITLNVRLRSSDMPGPVQNHALRHTRSLLDSAASPPPPASKTRPNPTDLARSLKKEFDSVYGPAWHCVVGTSFGSFVTHSPGGFLYFSVDDSLSVLLFKTEVQLVKEKPQAAKP